MAKVSDALRKAIIASGIPLLRIEQETGVHRGSLSRFVRGERGLQLAVVDTLAAYLKLELRKWRR
jgi:transcriptional regulator with XRE-family HTH domain